MYLIIDEEKNCRHCGKITSQYLYYNGLIHCPDCYLKQTYKESEIK